MAGEEGVVVAYELGVEMVRRSVLSIVLACATACGGSGDNPISPSTTGTLTVMLTDSPFSDAQALFVTFSRISAHRSGGAFETIPFVPDPDSEVVPPSRTCDLKKLETATDVLGVGALPPGHFTQVRLVVSSAVIYFDNPSSGMPCASMLDAPNGSSVPVKIPSNEIKLNREFDVTSNGTTTMLLDFDGDRSVKGTGNGTYRMTPVIAVVSVQ